MTSAKSAALRPECLLRDSTTTRSSRSVVISSPPVSAVFSFSRDRSRSGIKPCNHKNQIWDKSRNKWYFSHSGCGIKSGIHTTFLARNCGLSLCVSVTRARARARGARVSTHITCTHSTHADAERNCSSQGFDRSREYVTTLETHGRAPAAEVAPITSHVRARTTVPVSYTHLTLPTILRV